MRFASVSLSVKAVYTRSVSLLSALKRLSIVSSSSVSRMSAAMDESVFTPSSSAPSVRPQTPARVSALSAAVRMSL